MSKACHMHADLMRSSRFKFAFYIAKAAVSLKYCIVCDSRLCAAVAVLKNCHFLAVCGVSADGCVDRAIILLKISGNYCVVYSADRVCFQLFCKRYMRRIVFCNDEQTARVLVYSVYYARSHDSADTRKRIAEPVKQCIYKCSAVISRRRVNHHSRWFVYHYDIVVLVNDV